MFLEANRSNGTTVDRLITKLGTATRLIKRVATRHHGMKEASLLRLVQSFATSNVAYIGAFHYWKVQERDKINAAIRKAHKATLGLLNCTSTARLLELGVNNTLEEIAEAQRTAQLERLSTTRTGRSILTRLGFAGATTPPQQQEAGVLPAETLQRLKITPLPRNVNPENNPGRRAARAKALTDTYANDTGALFVDAAKYADRKDTYVAVVVKATTGEVYSACSIRAPSACQAEEVAIALALTDRRCSTILSDSRSAIKNYARNSVCASAVRVAHCSAVNDSVPATHLRWFPAHTITTGSGSSSYPNRNETADAAARDLSNRAAAPTPLASAEGADCEDCDMCSDDDDETDPLLGYAEVLGWYRYGRRTMPPPHPGLTREQAVLYRQLQTRSVLTPALARYVCPEVFESEVCSVCKRAKATLTHILWDCDLHPEEAVASPGRLPEDIARAVLSQDLTEQLQAVQRLEVALARQTRGAEPAGDRGYKPHRSTAGRPSGSRGGNTPKTP